MTTTLRSGLDGFELTAHRVDARGPRKGAVVVIQEIFGVSDHIRERCAMFADHGYDAIAPSIFDRLEKPFEAPLELEGIMKGRAAVDATPWHQVASDVQAAIDAVEGPVFVVGFCYGGAVAWLAASRCTGITAVTCFYGRLINALLDDVPKVPTELHYGAKDPSIQPDQVRAVRARHPDVTVHLYDAGHGFCRADSGDYDEAACTLATERTLGWFAIPR